MSIRAPRSVRLLALGLGLGLSSAAYAAAPTISNVSNGSFTLNPSVLTAGADEQANMEMAAEKSEGDVAQALYLADSAGPNIHGFLSSPFKSAYVTPRGLVVENQGLVWQPVGGFVFPLGDFGPLKGFTFVTGVWNCFTFHQKDNRVGPWNEVDYFASVNWTIGDNLNFALTYGAWFFPQSTENKPETEHNLDLKISYGDSTLWGSSGFSLNPYVDFFYAISGSSTVVLGDTGSTGYVELGVVPTWTFKSSPDYPLTFTFPTYIQVGPEGYWDATGAFDDSNFGVFSASANVSVPMAFIPKTYGYWHFDAGVSYYYLINDALLQAGNILSGNDDRSIFVGSVGVGVNF